MKIWPPVRRWTLIWIGLGVIALAGRAGAPVRPAAALGGTRLVVRAPAEPGDATPPELARFGLRVLTVPADPERAAAVWRAAAATGSLVQTAQPVWAQDVTPNDPGWSQQYGPALIQAPPAWFITTGTLSATLAIVDTGIDLNHPDLIGQLITGTTLVTGTTTPQDDNGHGTHVAGIAAAAGDNGMGIAGMAWGARLMPVKVLDHTGYGEDLDVATGMIWAVDHGATIINLSLGGDCPSPVLEIAATYAYTMGVTVVAAAGNSGKAQILCPAAVPSVIAVGAVGANRQRAAYSAYGAALDLAAPGTGIYSTLPVSLGSYGYKSGTSMAAPHVAGAAALLAAQGFDTPDKIRIALEGTAIDLGAACRDSYYGAGLVQVRAALDSVPGQRASARSQWCQFIPDLAAKIPFSIVWLTLLSKP